MGSGTEFSGIRDNHKRGKVGEFLRQKIQADSTLSFVSAYFTIYAYEAMRAELESIGSLRFLFGEPRFVRNLDPEKTDKKAFNIEDAGLRLTNRLEQRRAAKDCADWIRRKVEIRSVRFPGFLHGKLYHVEGANGVQDALLGSSNFTAGGLGLGTGQRNNIELNLEVDGNRDRNDLLQWFNEIWTDEQVVEDVKAEVLGYLEQLYTNPSPEFIYFKTLYHLFADYLAEADRGGLLDTRTGFFETHVWDMLYDFQKDGVKGAINKILKHNGCIIADSVGLGKTFEALAVIKYFELRNARVLVLCPKKLEDNWAMYRNNDTRNPLLQDRFAYTVMAHTDLGLDKFSTHNWGNYDLIVLDESHNFRNNTRGGLRDDGTRRRTRYEFLMEEILQSGVDTKVLLLSATPVNNSLRDLRNQILLITQDKDGAFRESLAVTSIAQTMQNAQTHFTNWADPNKNPERKVQRLLDALDSSFFKLLDELTIARSRRHITSYYGTKGVSQFPERLRVLARSPDTDLKGYFPTYDELNELIKGYKLTIFNPSAYLHDAHVNTYIAEGQLALFNDQQQREFFLIGMMRVNYLKRLESSISSFEVSIDRTIQKINALLDKIDHFETNIEEFTNPDLFNEMDDEEEAQLLEQLAVGKKLVIKLDHLDRKRWKQDLKADVKQLIAIHEKAAAVTPDRDAKLKELKTLIAGKVRHPINPGNRKVLVFTAYSDTAEYLYRNIAGWAMDELGLHTGLVTGSGENRTNFKPAGFRHQTDFISVLTNFSPHSKHREKMTGMPQEGGIDILIASDCISEGQNLQDCDYLINYDIHWNPVRIIQRFGRIDRLGSANKQIQLVNFWPTDDLNKYLNLKDRVEAKMALVDVAATGADNLLNPDQIRNLVEEDLTYREKQLLRLKEEVIDLEDMDDNVSLSEFTLDDFRIELMNFLANNRKALEEAPLGLYGLVPTLDGMKDPDLFDKNWHEIVKPGVIFCLRHKNPPSADKKASNVNPLGAHYLLYIRDDGTVRFTFTHAKNTLTLFQKLCSGRSEPYQELCDLFDAETDHGRDMRHYDTLLAKAVASIAATFQKRVAVGLQSGRDFVIPDQKAQVKDDNDFELITWLVIKEGPRSA